MVQNVRLQRLRDFTVQIRDPDSDSLVGPGIVGTGIVIEPDRIITCAHVVEAALGRSPRDAADEKVEIHFPRIEGREPLSLHAVVDCCFREHDDDIIALKLVDGTAPLGPDQLAKLGSADPSEGNSFRSYGYSPTGDYPATIAKGTIMGNVEPPEDKVLLVDPVQLESTNIDRGMSGSAVLDIERNLVVGLVAARYYPKGLIKPGLAYAVDNRVLTYIPFQFPLSSEANPLQPAPEPKIDKAEARALVAKSLGQIWNSAPPSLQEWTGRTQLLQDITSDWINSKTRITGLVGFGGEGKSSLAREWVDKILAGGSTQRPDSLFWWGFYERRNVDEFFDEALTYLSGGKIDPKRIPSSNMKARAIGAMLGAGRFLFVLDGLEVLQHQYGDMEGSILSPDLKAFLGFFASPDHDSFCLITTRMPLMDLEEFTTFQHRDMERLSPQDGRDLLRKLGVHGDDGELDRVVADWDGHALTLSLLGSYLRDHHGGDVRQIRNIPSPDADEPRYERVKRVLRHDDRLQEAEKAFMMLFSAFRRPVEKDAFRIFRAKSEKQGKALSDPIAAMTDSQFESLVKRLIDYRILRLERGSGLYTTHPLIRAHYSILLTKGSRGQAEEVHRQIKDYYLSMAQYLPYRPTLEDLMPLIEAVHHACHCGDYDEAYRILWTQICLEDRAYITASLGAYETMLEIVLDFFPGKNASDEPLTQYKSWILNEVGLCLFNLGQGNLAEGFFKRAIDIDLRNDHWQNASADGRNLSLLYSLLGELDKSQQAAYASLELAKKDMFFDFETRSLTHLAWVYHLRGDLEKASKAFLEAEAREKKDYPSRGCLCSLWGILYADHLRRMGKANYARRIINSNFNYCKKHDWPDDLSRCHRVLGDLFANAKKEKEARKSYDQSLKFARSISNKLVLIEALLGRGLWHGKIMKDPAAASSDLTEALEYARAGGYRLYEADARIGLAWAHLAAGDKAAAKAEADYVRRMSQEMGYYWGRKDAEEVLGEIEKQQSKQG